MSDTFEHIYRLLYVLNLDKRSESSVLRSVTPFTSAPELSNLSYMIPKETYRPEVKIAIDFMHKYSLDFEDESGKIGYGVRLVDKDVLLNRAEQLFNFCSYYFGSSQYSDTAGKKSQDMSSAELLKKIRSNLSTINEEKANIFINTILNYFVTDIAVTRSIKDIGTCSITLKDNPDISNITECSTLFFDSSYNIINQILTPMLPITIWAKGRIYDSYWFPIFTGFLFQISPQNTGGFSSVTIHGRDGLELARTSYEMINPALINYRAFKAQNTINIFSQPFYNQSMKKIIEMTIQGGKLNDVLNDKTGQRDKDTAPKDNTTATKDGLEFSKLGNYNFRSDTNLFEKGPDLYFYIPLKSTEVTDSIFINKLRYPKNVTLWGENITPYKGLNFASPKTYTSDFSSRFDIISGAAQNTYMDFYVDAFGNIRVHPMRLSNKFFEYESLSVNDKFSEKKAFPNVYIIGPQETTMTNTLFNIQNVITYIRVGGLLAEFGTTTPENSIETDMLGVAVDTAYMAKYGFRLCETDLQCINYNFIINKEGKTYKLLDLAARELLKYKNGELYTRNDSIIFRPELELANPIYFVDTQDVFYLQSITHNITIGQSATTTINCNFGRKVHELPPMLWDFVVANQKLYNFYSGSGTWRPSAEEMINGMDLAKYYQQEMDRYIFPNIEDADKKVNPTIEAPKVTKKKSNKKPTSKTNTNTTMCPQQPNQSFITDFIDPPENAQSK
jgi:hypothetical protein